MGDLTAALDQFAAIVTDDEVVDALNEFSLAAAALAVRLEERGMEDPAIAATLAGHLAATIVEAIRAKPDDEEEVS